MTEPSINTCKLCGITRLNNVPYFSHGNRATTNEQVATLVCRYAKPRDGLTCANPCSYPQAVQLSQDPDPRKRVDVDTFELRLGRINSIGQELEKEKDIVYNPLETAADFDAFIEGYGMPESDEQQQQ